MFTSSIFLTYSSRGAVELCYPGSSCGGHETWVHCSWNNWVDTKKEIWVSSFVFLEKVRAKLNLK